MGTKTTAVRFDGATQFATLSTVTSIRNLGNFTFLAWVKIGADSTGFDQSAYIEFQSNANKYRKRFAMTPLRDRIRFELAVRDGDIDTNYDYPFTFDNRWHLLGFTARINSSDPQYEIFVDGTQRINGTLSKRSGDTAIQDTQPKAIVLGKSVSTNAPNVVSEDLSHFWQGIMSEVSIYNEAIPAEDVLAYYTSRDTVNTSDSRLVFYWPMSEGTGAGAGAANITEFKTGQIGTLLENRTDSTANNTSMWVTDRPFLGSRANDTTSPAAPTYPSTIFEVVGTDNLTVAINPATDNLQVQRYELDYSLVSNFATFTTMTLVAERPISITPTVSFEGPPDPDTPSGSSLEKMGNGTVTKITTDRYRGVNSLQLVSSTASGNTGVGVKIRATGFQEKRPIPFSAAFYIKGTVGTGFIFTGNNINLTLKYSDGVTDVATPSSPITLTSGWQRVEITGLFPRAGKTITEVILQVYTGTIATNVTYLLDVVCVTTSDIAPALPSDDAPTFTITGLVPATNYYIRVRAIDEAGNASANSSTASITTLAVGDITPPNPPTNTTISSLSSTTFGLAWTHSTSGDKAGYRLDVAYDGTFSTFVTGYQDIDIGNVNTYTFTGGAPLTTYYVRLRTYDTAGNESVDTNTLAVQTTPAPDVTPPNIVPLSEASSIASTSFTANWLEAVDDTGILDYLLDVATDAAFTQMVSGYSNLNVGNVLSYPITGLVPSTVYYYRLRARDAALNVSANTDAPTDVLTSPPTIVDGGLISTQYEPTGDAYVQSGSPTTNFGASTSLIVVGNGSSATSIAYLQLDLRDLIGLFQTGMIALYVTEASAQNMTIKVMAGTFDPTTITYNTRPTMTGSSILFTPNTLNNWSFVDISSLFLAGNVQYIVEISTTNTDGATFGSRESTTIPYFVVESDPSIASELQSFSVQPINAQRKNWCKNPSFETNTSNWTTLTTGVSITRLTALAQKGTSVIQVVDDGTVSGQGIRTLSVAALNGQTWTCSAYLRSVTGASALTLTIQEVNAADNTVLASTTTNITITTAFGRFSVTRKLNNASTSFIRFVIGQQAQAAATFVVDAVLMEQSPYLGAYFDGDTSGAWWSGTVHASESLQNSSIFNITGTYIGDADGDNSPAVYVKRSSDNVRMGFDALNAALVNNRTTKTVTGQIGPSFGTYNTCANPSFEVNTTGWGITAGATITRITTDAYVGTCCLQVTSSATIGSGLWGGGLSVPANAGETWNARVHIKAPIGVQVNLVMTATTASGTFIASSPVVAGINGIVGDGTWQEATLTYVLPATTGSIYVSVITNAAIATTFYVDAVQYQKGPTNNPYRDGDSDDAVWEGAPDNSTTGILFLPSTTYNLTFALTDADGVVGSTTQTGELGQTVETPVVQDNLLTTQSIALSPSIDSIDVSVIYSGDDNANAAVLLEFKRTDLASWSAVPTTWDRANKQIRATIAGLNAGTSYTVRATFTDSDGLYGTNPLSAVTVTTTDAGSADVTPTISFGGFVLMGRPDGKIGVTSHDAFGLPERRVQIESLPRVDGAVELDNYWGQKVIKMQGFVAGDTRADLEDTKNALRLALAQKQQQLIIDTLSTHGRFYYATCTSFGSAEVAGQNYRHLTWDAEFTCADPFSYSLIQTEITQVTVANNGHLSFLNEGDLTISPVLTINTTYTLPINVTIANLTTGQLITPITALGSADTLVIDNQRLAVTLNGIEVDYSGGFIDLALGSNIIEFRLSTASGTPSILVAASWRNRYL